MYIYVSFCLNGFSGVTAKLYKTHDLFMFIMLSRPDQTTKRHLAGAFIIMSAAGKGGTVSHHSGTETVDGSRPRATVVSKVRLPQTRKTVFDLILIILFISFKMLNVELHLQGCDHVLLQSLMILMEFIIIIIIKILNYANIKALKDIYNNYNI